MPKRPVVGVFGHYGNRNLGDEAIVAATIQQLRQRLEDAEIVCFSLRPQDTAVRHGVETFSVRYLPHCRVPVRPDEGVVAADLPWNTSSSDPAVTVTGKLSRAAALRQRVKALPMIGPLATFAARLLTATVAAAHEVRFIFQSAAYLKRFDLLVVAGSNQFLDNFEGTWGFPYALLKWAVLAKLNGTKLAFVSVGAGPLEGRLSRLFVRLAIRLSDYTSYRDFNSKTLVESGYPTVSGLVCPDLAFGLGYDRQSMSLAKRDRPVIGINPMPVYDRRYWFEHDDGRYHAYVEKLAIFAAKLIEGNYSVFFFPTMWRDDDVIRDVLEALKRRCGRAVDLQECVRPSQHVNELVAVLRSADIVVATRFHAAVLPYHLGVPVLGIGYFRKTFDLMQQMGQADYHESLDNLDVLRLWEKFGALEANWAVEQQKIAQRTATYRRQIDDQWAAVVKLADSGKRNIGRTLLSHSGKAQALRESESHW
jgi:polysaccharide pyruvyl transferase WcaK-like protein